MDPRLHHLQREAKQLTPVVIALGSNLGDRREHLAWAADHLAVWLEGMRLSRFVETEPMDVPTPQPPYLNAVAVGRTSKSAGDVLETLLNLEGKRGRERCGWHAPRTLDLDLVLYGGLMTAEPGLTVPHPHFREREFVLAPLVEVAPDVVDPLTGLTAAQLLAKLRRDRT